MYRYACLALIILSIMAGCASEDPGKNPMKVNVSVSAPVSTTLGESAQAEFVFSGMYNSASSKSLLAADTPTSPSSGGITPFYTFTSYRINYNQTLPTFNGGSSIYGVPGKDVKAMVLVYPSSYSDYITKLPFVTGAYITFIGSDHEGRPIEAQGHFTITIKEDVVVESSSTTTSTTE